jgi:hypothetical protein
MELKKSEKYCGSMSEKTAFLHRSNKQEKHLVNNVE